MFLNESSTNNASADIDLNRYDAMGRSRLNTDDDCGFTVEFDLTYLNLVTSDPSLPPRLVDQSITAGFGIGHDNEWAIPAIVGTGYAGNNAFGDGDALYTLADLIATRRIDDRISLRLILDWNGNRSIFPDLPLPAISYQKLTTDKLSYTVGLPISAIAWEPTDRASVNLTYSAPLSLNATASYKLSCSLDLFGRFASGVDAFKLDGSSDHRRLFFQQRRIEDGFRFRVHEVVDLALAGGYAFDQEFNRDFDVCDVDSAAKVSDEPYVRTALSVRV
jgi:hypothetical protein